MQESLADLACATPLCAACFLFCRALGLSGQFEFRGSGRTRPTACKLSCVLTESCTCGCAHVRPGHLSHTPQLHACPAFTHTYTPTHRCALNSLARSFPTSPPRPRACFGIRGRLTGRASSSTAGLPGVLSPPGIGWLCSMVVWTGGALSVLCVSHS